MTVRRWLVLAVAGAVAALLVSLAFPVDSSMEFGPGTPSCGSPLMQGVDFSSSHNTTFDGTDLASWQRSTMCGGARAQRLVDNATLTGVLLVAVVTLIAMARARRRLLNSGFPTSPGGGIIAALINPLLGPLVGLIFARQTGTRRMLTTQVAANLGMALSVGLLALGGLASSRLGGGPSDTVIGIEFGAVFVMSALSLAFPVSLLFDSRKPQRI